MVSVINVELSSELYKCSVLKETLHQNLSFQILSSFEKSQRKHARFHNLRDTQKAKGGDYFVGKGLKHTWYFPFLGKKKEILNIKGLINLPRTSIVFLYGLTYFFGSTFSDWSKYCEEAKLARSSYYLVDVSESVHRNSDPRGIRFDLVDNQDHRQRKTQGWIFTLESQAGEGLINLLLSFSVSILPPFLTFSYPSSFFSGNLLLERELHNY